MIFEKILKKIGLSDEQAKIYISLLENGELSIFQISQKSRIHRPRIYKILPSLIEMGLVYQCTKGKRKMYLAENPQHLQEAFESIQQEFFQAMKYFSQQYEKKKNNLLVKTIQGKRFSLAIFDDVLQELGKDEIQYRYSSRIEYQDDLKYEKRRKIGDEKEIQSFFIVNKFLAEKQKKSLNYESKTFLEQKEHFDDNLSKVIYKDKVAIIDYTNKVSYVIENERFANFEKKIFRQLYNFL